ncbi:hypothetical protein D3C72_2366950 [compost metagenome]
MIGPILGAFTVNGLKSWFTADLPELWLFALGLLFIGVTLFMQQGMLGVLSKLKRKKAVAAAEEAA